MTEELKKLHARILQAKKNFLELSEAANCDHFEVCVKAPFGRAFGPLLAECEPRRAKFEVGQVVMSHCSGPLKIAAIERDGNWNGGIGYSFEGVSLWLSESNLRLLTPAEIGPRE